MTNIRNQKCPRKIIRTPRLYFHVKYCISGSRYDRRTVFTKREFQHSRFKYDTKNRGTGNCGMPCGRRKSSYKVRRTTHLAKCIRDGGDQAPLWPSSLKYSPSSPRSFQTALSRTSTQCRAPAVSGRRSVAVASRRYAMAARTECSAAPYCSSSVTAATSPAAAATTTGAARYERIHTSCSRRPSNRSRARVTRSRKNRSAARFSAAVAP